MTMYKALKGAGTPGFLGIRLKKDGQPVIFLRNSGGFSVAADFMQELLETSGLKN